MKFQAISFLVGSYRRIRRVSSNFRRRISRTGSKITRFNYDRTSLGENENRTLRLAEGYSRQGGGIAPGGIAPGGIAPGGIAPGNNMMMGHQRPVKNQLTIVSWSDDR